jgi:hypothetical protein
MPGAFEQCATTESGNGTPPSSRDEMMIIHLTGEQLYRGLSKAWRC